MHIAVVLVQFTLLGILLYILYNNLTYCQGYFSLCNGTKFLTSSNATGSITATILLGTLAWKFLSMYNSNKRNFLLLLYGLAAAALAISVAWDAFDKLLLAQVVQEKSPAGAIPQSSFIYETFEKYHGEIEYKVVNPQVTTLYVVPSSLLDLYNQIIYWTSLLPYILTWAGTALLLGYYYKRTGKLDLKFWVILAIPLVLYLVGSGLIFSLPSDIPYRFYFRQLTEDILDVSRIESNSLRLKKEHFNLSEMVLNCISDFRNQIKKENRDSNLDLKALFSLHGGTKKNEKVANEDIVIKADRNRLYQVISNLLSNAIKFTKEGITSVSIERRKGGGRVTTNTDYNYRTRNDGDAGNDIVYRRWHRSWNITKIIYKIHH